MDVFGIADQDIIGFVFIASFFVFGYGVSIPGNEGMDRSVFGTASTEQFLEIIGTNPGAWRRSAAWLAAGTILNTVGFGLIALLTAEAGAPLLSMSGLLVFLNSTIAWITGMAFRMSVETLAAENFTESKRIPNWFEPIQVWNTAMGMIYMELGYIATMTIGVALLQSSLLPGWIGWLTLVLGASGAVSIVTTRPKYPGTEYSIAAVPFWLHIMPFIIGAALIIQ